MKSSGLRCCFFILILPIVQCCSAQADTLWPKHRLILSLGTALQAPLNAYAAYGPQREFRSRGGYQTGVGLEYNRSLDNGYIVGGMAQLVSGNWRFDMKVDRPEHNVIDYRGVNERARPFFWTPAFAHPEFTLLFGKGLSATPRWRWDIIVHAGIVPLWSSWMTMSYAINLPTDTSYLSVFQVYVSEGLDIYPLLGLRLQSAWQAKNHNIWLLMLEGRITPTNYYDGDYILYQGTSTEGGGSLRGRLAYIGLRLGYSFTWGAPRRPGWMIRNEKRERHLEEKNRVD